MLFRSDLREAQSTDGQSVATQVDQLTRAGAEEIFREKISGAVTHRQQLKRTLDALDEGDVLLVTRLDRLARSTCDLLNTLAGSGEEGAFPPSATVGPTPRPRTVG